MVFITIKASKSTKLIATIGLLVSIIIQLWYISETHALSKLLFPVPNHLRFCYQPGDQTNQQMAPLSSQCVFCARNMFDHTLFRCTGISAVQQSINTTQAFCIISNCLDQIPRQYPVLLGK